MTQPPSPALEAAWTAALDAPAKDQRPWRVLSDMLLAERDERGELLRLELDAELGPLKGLAKGRLRQLRASLRPRLVPADAGVVQLRLWRTVPIEVSLVVHECTQPRDLRWRTVRRLRFSIHEGVDGAEPWRQTPIVGDQLERVERLENVAEEALPLLLWARPMTKLVHLGIFNADGRPAGTPHLATELLWTSLCARHPSLTELSVGAERTFERAVTRLDTLLTVPLKRVLLPVPIDVVPRLETWRRQRRAPFVLGARLSQRETGAVLDLRDGALRLSGPANAVEAARLGLRSAWPGHPPLSVVVEPETTGPFTFEPD